jgi:hypothetical protein
MLLRSFVAAILLVSSVAVAQTNNCDDATKPSTVGNVDGVTIQKLILSGTWGRNEATVFFPKITDGAVVLSHSAIHEESGDSIDLLPMAMTLAHAGAAVIVPTRSLEWPPKNGATNREGAVVFCAVRWIVKNTTLPNGGVPVTNSDNRVIREFYGYVGPRVCRSATTPDCKLTSPFLWPNDYRASSVVPIGEEGNGSTKFIIADRGLKAAQWLQKRLGLRPITAIEVPPSSAGL